MGKQGRGCKSNAGAVGANVASTGEAAATRRDDGRDHAGRPISARPRQFGPGIREIDTQIIELYDLRKKSKTQVRDVPTVHVVRGAGKWIPFLNGPEAAPLVCLSDWQFERTTQKHFWAQAQPVIEDACGGPENLSRALVLVAGDMASAGNDLRGRDSDDVPDLSPFAACLGGSGALLFVYGNHDDEVHSVPSNASGVSQLLPDGGAVATGRHAGVLADRDLRVGGVHGIPSNKVVKVGSEWKKRPRDVYFRQFKRVCTTADVVVAHANPQIPGQDEVDGPDAPRMFDEFQRGSAQLLVHGHMHTPEVVTVVSGDRGERVIVNCDCRVVVLLPGGGGRASVAGSGSGDGISMGITCAAEGTPESGSESGSIQGPAPLPSDTKARGRTNLANEKNKVASKLISHSDCEVIADVSVHTQIGEESWTAGNFSADEQDGSKQEEQPTVHVSDGSYAKVCQQVAWLLSDAGLKKNQFLRDTVLRAKDGWLNITSDITTIPSVQKSLDKCLFPFNLSAFCRDLAACSELEVHNKRVKRKVQYQPDIAGKCKGPRRSIVVSDLPAKFAAAKSAGVLVIGQSAQHCNLPAVLLGGRFYKRKQVYEYCDFGGSIDKDEQALGQHHIAAFREFGEELFDLEGSEARRIAEALWHDTQASLIGGEPILHDGRYLLFIVPASAIVASPQIAPLLSNISPGASALDLLLANGKKSFELTSLALVSVDDLLRGAADNGVVSPLSLRSLDDTDRGSGSIQLRGASKGDVMVGAKGSVASCADMLRRFA